MKYLFAVLACIALFFLYVLIGVAMGWRHGGGFLPMMLLLTAMGFAWRSIAGSKQVKGVSTELEEPIKPEAEDKLSPPKPFVGFQDIPRSDKETTKESKQLVDGRGE
jgi:hypothetical protein